MKSYRCFYCNERIHGITIFIWHIKKIHKKDFIDKRDEILTLVKGPNTWTYSQLKVRSVLSLSTIRARVKKLKKFGIVTLFSKQVTDYPTYVTGIKFNMKKYQELVRSNVIREFLD